MRPVIFSLALLLAACGQTGAPAASSIPGELEPEGTPVMKVDGMVVTDVMIESITRGFPPQQLEQMKSSGQYEQFLEQIAIGQVLYKQAIADKLHEQEDVQMVLAIAQRDALAKEVIGKVSEAAITDEKLQEAYDKRKVQYASPQVEARHILVETKDEADAIVAELAGGADFAALAKEKSKDKGSGAKGGDLGWFKEGQMVKEFSEAAFAATGDEIVGPVESKFGFHVIQVTDRRDAIPLEDVKDTLEQQVKQDAVRAYLDELKEKADITFVDGDEGAAEPEAKAEAE